MSGLNVERLKGLLNHKNFKIPKSQLDYYREGGADTEILKYVELPGKTFGEKYMESLTKEYFNLDKRVSSGHDHTKLNKRIEQKSARYHSNGDDWKWQHIEMKHEWDYLLLTGLDFNDIKFYIASREIIENLIQKGLIVGQGKKDENGVAQAQQAYWFSRTDFKKKQHNFEEYFKQIKNEEELVNYLSISDNATDSIVA